MLPQRITRQAELTPFLTHCSGLFLALSLEGFAPKKHNSFAIKQIQTLSAKHRGGRMLRTKAPAQFTLVSSPAPRSQHLPAPQASLSAIVAIDLLVLCFQSVTNPYFRNPFPCTSIQNPGGLGVRTQSCTQNFNCRLWTFPIPRGRAGGNTACPLLGLGGGVGAAGGRRCVLRSRFRRC